MEQAQELLKDPSVHVAAPVVLAGASLEEFLRSMIVDAGLTPTGKPGINTYSSELQKTQLINRGEVKEITAWALPKGRSDRGPITRAGVVSLRAHVRWAGTHPDRFAGNPGVPTISLTVANEPRSRTKRDDVVHG